MLLPRRLPSKGGYGIPFDVDTASGKPMTEIMSAAIENGLKEAGYTVVSVSGNNNHVYLVNAATKNNASRIVVLKVLDWKSDVMWGVTLHSNLDLSIFDAEGKLLAESSKESMGKISQGSWATEDDNSRALADEFSKSVRELFDVDQVRRALQ